MRSSSSPNQQLQQRPRASASTVTQIVEPSTTEQAQNSADRLVMRLESPNTQPRVRWTEGTVDNEHMGKKKSKCCCIYKKKRNFDESGSSEDEDCQSAHCRGHVEQRKPPAGGGDGGGQGPSPPMGTV